MHRMKYNLGAAAVSAIAVAALAIAMLSHAATGQERAGPRTPDAPAIEQAIRNSWSEQRPDWRARLQQDEIMRLCSRYRNKPPRRVSEAIQRLARAGIVYPADGVLIGSWQAGEAIAQSGYGQRFTDNDASRSSGGNCYACHRIGRTESSHGTLGPDLSGYGRIKEFSPAAARKVYEQIYNAHLHHPCSTMPRFGANGTLSVAQIKDLVALLMARDSPVNR